MKRILLFVCAIAISTIGYTQSAKDYFFQGRDAYRSGKHDEAISLLNKAIIAHQSQPAFWNLRGAAKAANNDHEGAISDYGEALALNPQNANYQNNLGISLERIGRLEDAKKAFVEALRINPDLWIAVSSLGNIALEYEDYNLAVQYFSQAAQLAPESFNPPNNMAYAYNQLGNYQLAIEQANKAIELNGNGASAYNHLGFAYYQQGELTKATQNIDQAIAKDESYAKAYYSKGLILQKQNQVQGAVINYRKALELTPPFQAFYQQPFNALKDLEKQINSTNPPLINLSSPTLTEERGFTSSRISVRTDDDVIVFQGRVTSANIINSFTINSNPVLLDPEGYFNSQFPLVDERSDIDLRAVDSRGQETVLKVSVIRNPRTKQLNQEVEIEEPGKSYALVIGMADYEHPQLNDLKKPVIDAKLLRQTLINHYDFAESNVYLLENPTRPKLFQILEALAIAITSKDNLLIFYAGHGHWDEQFQNGYWLLNDATPYNRATWFSNNDLKDFVRGIKSRHTLLITDACFSGSIFISHGTGTASQLPVTDLYVVKSRNAMTSGALQTVPDESAFLKYLVMRLKDNKKPYLPAVRLFDSMNEAVMQSSQNVPQFGTIEGTGSEGGDFIFIAK